MTQEEKILLLQDLCARLPYGVIVQDRNGVHKLSVGNTEFTDLFGGKCNIKPYLRPLSSMTEEEIEECHQLQQDTIHVTFDEYDKECEKTIDLPYFKSLVEFYNSRHLDYCGLIPMGLAIEVTEENNPYKECL